MKLSEEKQIRDYTALMLLALGLFFYGVLFILWNFSPEEPLTIVPARETSIGGENALNPETSPTYRTQASNL